MNDFATTDAAGVLPDTSDHNPDIAEILRNQSGKILNAIIDIEEKVDQLAEAFGSRLQVFTQEKISLEFSSMSVFSEKSLLDEKAALTPLFSVHGDEDKLIACFRLHQDTARLLLTITLGGHDTPTNELGENELRPSELKLFALLIDYLMSGFFESIDVDANLGIPRKPVFVKNEDFAELAEGIELVSFIFEFSAEQKNGFLELLVPLEVFENDDSERAEKLAAESRP